MIGNGLAQFVKDIADGLRNRQIPHIAEHVSETYTGPIGADGLRAVNRRAGDADVSGAEQVKHAMDGTARPVTAEENSTTPDISPGHEAHPQDQRDAPLIVANELDRLHLSGVRARWEPVEEAESPSRKFEAWMRSPTEGPLPPLSPDSGLNCWEMLLWAGARKNVITHAELHSMYAPLAEGRLTGEHTFRSKWKLLPDEFRVYKPGDSASPQPERGDVIVWGESEHVAMATGRTARDGSPEVYSFWPAPKHDFTVDPVTGSSATVTDAVQLTSIDELHPFINKPTSTWVSQILFGRGPW